jgi:hypothetical protein
VSRRQLLAVGFEVCGVGLLTCRSALFLMSLNESISPVMTVDQSQSHEVVGKLWASSRLVGRDPYSEATSRLPFHRGTHATDYGEVNNGYRLLRRGNNGSHLTGSVPAHRIVSAAVGVLKIEEIRRPEFP